MNRFEENFKKVDFSRKNAPLATLLTKQRKFLRTKKQSKQPL